jgi:hypothetical protein
MLVSQSPKIIVFHPFLNLGHLTNLEKQIYSLEGKESIQRLAKKLNLGKVNLTLDQTEKTQIQFNSKYTHLTLPIDLWEKQLTKTLNFNEDDDYK